MPPLDKTPPRSGESSVAWKSLVHRSVKAWHHPDQELITWARDCLQTSTSLDEFLAEGSKPVVFWFFQRREVFLSQKTIRKWSCDCLDDYILLPALDGFVTRSECFFVSHFWQTKEHPDPSGDYLKPLQQDLRLQTWSYIWTDWTCLPQHPRRHIEELYFRQTLQTMSGIIRNAGFVWYYPPFEARLWILYEVAEYMLTCSGEMLRTPDNEKFVSHVHEMLQVGVRPTIQKHGYRSTYDGDMEHLTPWLELLVLLTNLHVDIDDVRRLMSHITWHSKTAAIWTNSMSGLIRLDRFEGELIINEEHYTFTPFPRLVSHLWM